MYAVGLRCDDCRSGFDMIEVPGRCPKCGGLLEFQYDYEGLRKHFRWDRRPACSNSIWRWIDVFPIRFEDSVVTLGEGGTPCVRSAYIGPSLGLASLHFKNDTIMPTGSFKDRGFALAMSWAKEHRIRRGLTYTSGNAGHSFAAYARRIGLEAVVLMSSRLSQARYRLQQVLGYPIIRISYDSFDEVDDLMSRLSEELDTMQFVNFINPVRHEAMKTYAYELYEDLGGKLPDHVIQPMGTGGGYWGAFKGFEELRILGLTENLPRMHVVQPAATPPVVQAFEQGLSECKPAGDRSATIAQSIAADDPIGSGRRVLQALKVTAGRAIAVSDDEIRWAMGALGAEGIWAEPAGAASVASLRQLIDRGAIQPQDTVVCVITGSGLKEPDLLPVPEVDQVVEVPATEQAVMEQLRRLWPSLGS